MYWQLGWGSIQDGVQLFQYLFLTGVLLGFSWGGGLIKTGAQFAPIRYVSVVSIEHTVCLIESLEQPTYFAGRWVDTSWVTCMLDRDCTFNRDIREGRSDQSRLLKFT